MAFHLIFTFLTWQLLSATVESASIIGPTQQPLEGNTVGKKVPEYIEDLGVYIDTTLPLNLKEYLLRDLHANMVNLNYSQSSSVRKKRHIIDHAVAPTPTTMPMEWMYGLGYLACPHTTEFIYPTDAMSHSYFPVTILQNPPQSFFALNCDYTRLAANQTSAGDPKRCLGVDHVTYSSRCRGYPLLRRARVSDSAHDRPFYSLVRLQSFCSCFVTKIL